MNSKQRHLIVAFMILLIGLSTSSCNMIYEDYSDCPRPFRLFIQAVDADEKDITDSGDVQQAILFVFNESGHIIDVITLSGNQIKSRQPVEIDLEYPNRQELLSFVVWGNTSGVEFPEMRSVKEWSDLYAKLRTQNSTAQSPSDLFYGDLMVKMEFGGWEPSGDQTVVIRRKTSQVIVTALNLKQWNGGKEGDYSFVLRESPDSYDEKGNLTGNKVIYKPHAVMKDGNLRTDIFLTFPTDERKSYVVDTYFNGKVIYSTEVNRDNTPLVPKVGRLLNIIINFNLSEISTKVVVTPWNVVDQSVEY